MPATIRALFHYPVKGLSAQPLDRVKLRPGEGFPADRIFGFARPGSGFDPDNPRPLPKGKFVVLARDAMLACLQTSLNAAQTELTLRFEDTSQTFDITQESGRADAARFLALTLGYEAEMTPTLVSAAPHRFTDVSVVSPAMMNAISLINIDSVTHFSDTIFYPVSPNRFRGNVLFDGLPAFAELSKICSIFRIGDVKLKLVQRTRRCPATEVNLDTGERDLDVPALLEQTYGHRDMGVYAEVLEGGEIKIGDEIGID